MVEHNMSKNPTFWFKVEMGSDDAEVLEDKLAQIPGGFVISHISGDEYMKIFWFVPSSTLEPGSDQVWEWDSQEIV